MTKLDENQKIIDHARSWQRPAFSAAVIVCVLWVTYKVRPEDAVAALVWFLLAGAVLYIWRGAVDKGGAIAIIRAWKGQSNDGGS